MWNDATGHCCIKGQIAELTNQGKTTRQVAEETRLSKTTVGNLLPGVDRAALLRSTPLLQSVEPNDVPLEVEAVPVVAQDLMRAVTGGTAT
jgi:orotate phosphoribosyltransferase-like protein